MEKDRGYIKVRSHRVEFPKDIKVIDRDVLMDLLEEYHFPSNSLYTEVSEVYIPSTVILIADLAFSRCMGIERVIIPKINSLKYIGHSAFFECPGLKYFDFGFCTQLRLVDEYAFLNTQIKDQQICDIPCREYVYYGHKLIGKK